MRNIILLATFFVIYSSCYYDKFDEIHPLSGYKDPCDPTVDSSYTKCVQYIMANNCLSCHNDQSAGGGISLQTYSEVSTQESNGNLMNAILGQNGHIQMPPNVPIQQCEINKLNQWIAGGKPQ